jgi:ATP-dependent Lon protease
MYSIGEPFMQKKEEVLAPEMRRELEYLVVQLSFQPKIHSQVEKSLTKLKEAGYPAEKVKAIKKEFEKPVEERQKDLERCKAEAALGWQVLECVITSAIMEAETAKVE